MIKALSVSISENLKPLSLYLWGEHIPHRISEHAGDQVIWVGNDNDVALVQAGYQRYLKGELERSQGQAQRPSLPGDAFSLQKIWVYMLNAPLVSMLILTSILVTLLMVGVEQQIFLWLRVGSPAYVLESGEFWRLVTPIFMHFTVLHLAFNMLMLWVFGHQIELRGERGVLTLLVLASAVLSNVAQYFVSGSGFGGMSGVVFAVLAYCWLWDRLNPEQRYGFPPALMGLMMAWLALGYTDFLRWVGFGSMANTAHLTGLMSGLVIALGISKVKHLKSGL